MNRNRMARLGRFLSRPGTIHAAAWLLAIAIAGGRWTNARLAYEDDSRIDGNHGHTSIDFGGQWLMGRMLTSGHGKELYRRAVQREVARTAFTSEYQTGEQGIHDADALLSFFMGTDEGEAIGGPLYPPIQAFVMAPLALSDRPQTAYYIAQWLMLGYCFLGGLGVRVLSQGRISWPLATALILAFPGCKGCIDLGQNGTLTLAILIWGWAVTARGYPILGGTILGLLAFKPVWAISFFTALILLRQWRACLAMGIVGAGLALATLPFVGIHSWFHWLEVGQRAAALYNVDMAWIPLSRDLLGVPRRLFIDFHLPRDERDNLLARAASVALWLVVFEITMRVYFSRRSRSVSTTGLLPAFIFLAAWMCTYHFMYYDALIAIFPIFVLLADPRPYLRPVVLRQDPVSGTPTVYLNSFVLTMLGLMIAGENTVRQLKLDATAVVLVNSSKRVLDDGSTILAPRLVIGSGDHYAWETLAVLILWLWAAIWIFLEEPVEDATVLQRSAPP